MKALLLSLLLSAPLSAQKVCNAVQYGAKPDGTTKSTAAIQKAIDTCAAAKGTVVLSGGTFVSGPLQLKTNVTLRVEKGTTLLGSPDHADYPSSQVLRAPGRLSLLYSDHADNITVTGGGTIDGNGQSWWEEARHTPNAGLVGAVEFRPRLAVFSYGRHIAMENITFQNSPSWQVVTYYCDGVVIRDVRILAPEHAPNTDAVDPFSTSNMLIERLYADVGDDNIAIKSGLVNSKGPDSPSKNITIRDCEFVHGHGLSIGSEIAGGVQNVTAERIRFRGTDQGIRVKSNRDRGNDTGHFLFKDIVMDDVKTAILLSEFYPKIPETITREPVQRLTPRFHDIRIENVTARNSGTAAVIVGLPESPILGLVLKNVHLEGRTGATIQYAEITAEDFAVKAKEGKDMVVGEGVRGLQK